MGACGDNAAPLLSIPGRIWAGTRPLEPLAGLGQVRPCPCLPGLCKKLCHQVKEIQEEVNRLNGVGEGDLWALRRGAAEMRASQALETVTGQHFAT